MLFLKVLIGSRSHINFPVIQLPEDLCAKVALLLRDKCNETISIVWELATGKDLKKFLTVRSLSIFFSKATNTFQLYN